MNRTKRNIFDSIFMILLYWYSPTAFWFYLGFVVVCSFLIVAVENYYWEWRR
jgi:hypothetical protein